MESQKTTGLSNEHGQPWKPLALEAKICFCDRCWSLRQTFITETLNYREHCICWAKNEDFCFSYSLTAGPSETGCIEKSCITCRREIMKMGIKQSRRRMNLKISISAWPHYCLQQDFDPAPPHSDSEFQKQQYVSVTQWLATGLFLSPAHPWPPPSKTPTSTPLLLFCSPFSPSSPPLTYLENGRFPACKFCEKCLGSIYWNLHWSKIWFDFIQ